MEQQKEGIHNGILEPITTLRQRQLGAGRGEHQPRQHEHHHHLDINFAENVNRQSVQYLVNFLRSIDARQVTELGLCEFKLLQPSDGGLEVLCNFLSNQTTLTKIQLFRGCNFGSEQEASRLLVAFQTNTTVTDLTIIGIRILHGAAFGRGISTSLLQNMPQLHRLELGASLDEDVIRAMQPGLRANWSLKKLRLVCCRIKYKGQAWTYWKSPAIMLLRRRMVLTVSLDCWRRHD
jgi:hypothetical protein